MKRHKTIGYSANSPSTNFTFPGSVCLPFKSTIGNYYYYYDCYANGPTEPAAAAAADANIKWSNIIGNGANVSKATCIISASQTTKSIASRMPIFASDSTNRTSSSSSSSPLFRLVMSPLCCLLTSIFIHFKRRPKSLGSKSPSSLGSTCPLIVPALCPSRRMKSACLHHHNHPNHYPHPHPHPNPRITLFYLLNLIITILCIITFFQLRSSWCLVYDGISEYHSIENDKVSLPCNISAGSEWNEAHISLVVWYRSGNKGTPIYSIDARNSLTSSRHQITPELNGRIKMDFSTMPPVLHIDSVKVSDAGDYRCRVDYRMNRTQQFLIHLNVSVPPKEIVIRDLVGNVVQGLINTPYNEGDKVSLFCDAIGGSPPPMVIWRSNDGQIIDDSYQSLGPETNITRNGLVLARIDRNHLLQELTCEAFPPVDSILSSLTPALSIGSSSSSSSSPSSSSVPTATTSTATTATAAISTTIRRTGYSFIRRSSVALDLNLKPLVVQIQVPKYNVSRSSQSGGAGRSSPTTASSPSAFAPSNVRTLIVSAGKKAEIECRSWGSRPPAEITWWRGSRRLPTAASRSETESSSFNKVANLTISILSYTALPEDDGQRLTCRADNLQLTNEELEDSVTISVQYAPQLSLSLGAKIPETIREGSDVYFECSVKANPPITEFVWMFEDRPLVNDPASGVLLTNMSLVMQRVRREHRGYYQCLAKNDENIASSKKVFLNVHFAPVCKPSQTLVFGVARTEHVVIPCEVESEPVTPINFRWFFNNSLESFELSKSDFTVELLRIPVAGISSEHGKTLYPHPTSSLLSRLSQESMGLSSSGVPNKPSVARSNATYSPRNRMGYGTLYCLAENSIGIQRDPCSFSIVEAGPPNSVHDCRIVNVTMTSFVLECVKGENGGLRQIFHLEVYNIEKEHLQVNVTSLDSPVFTVENLPHDTAFTLNVFSSNAKGRSDSVTLRTATTAYAEKHTTNGKKQSVLQFDDVNDLILSPMFGALVGALISLLLLCGAIVAFVRHRVCTTKRQITTKEAINSNGVPPNGSAAVETESFDQVKDGYGVGHSSTMHSINDYLMRSGQYTPNQQQPQQQQQQMNGPAFYRYQSHTGTLPLTLQHSHAGLLGGNNNQGGNRPEQMTMTEMSIVNTAQLDSNNGFYSITNSSAYPSNSTAILQHHSQQSQQVTSDLMTNAFTYNVASSTANGAGAGTLYPISADLIPVSCNNGNNHSSNARTYTEISSGGDMQQHPHHHHHHLATLGTMVGCIDSLSSSTSDKTVEVDEEWLLPKHHMHAHLLGRQPQIPSPQPQPPYMNYSNVRSNEMCISSSNATNSSPSRIANLPKVQFMDSMEPSGSPSKNNNNNGINNNNNTSITSV